MTRAQLLWLESWIAFAGAVFWLVDFQLPHTSTVVTISVIWGCWVLASIWIESLEPWSHRLSSFLGFLFCTVEGILGLLAFTPKSGLLLMAFFHGTTFLLAIAGKYQSRVRKRPRRNMEKMASEALEEVRRMKEAEPPSEVS